MKDHGNGSHLETAFDEFDDVLPMYYQMGKIWIIMILIVF